MAQLMSPIREGRGSAMKEQLWHRLHALMIASQLPEDPSDAFSRTVRGHGLCARLPVGEQSESKAAPKPNLTVVNIRGD